MTGQGKGVDVGGHISTETAAPNLPLEELEARLTAEFPEMFNRESGYAIQKLWHGGAIVRRRYHPRSLRPGGTVSGPSIMALADFTMYLAVLSAIGWVPLAVTTNFNINFLRKPAPRDLLAEARLIKLGKRLAVGDIGIRSDGGGDDLVAHATSTYSLPSDG